MFQTEYLFSHLQISVVDLMDSKAGGGREQPPSRKAVWVLFLKESKG